MPGDEAPKMAPLGDEAIRAMRRISRRSFAWAALAGAATYGGWRWLNSQYQEEGIIWPFRRVLELNEGVARDYFSPKRLAPQFPISAASEPLANGDIGIMDDLDPATWSLRVMGLADMSAADSAPTNPPPSSDKKSSGSRRKPPPTGEASPDSSSGASQTDMALADSPAMKLDMDTIRQLPKTEIVTQLKCIEGWATVVHWAGVRFADFVAKYPPETQSGSDPDVRRHPEDLAQYVSLVTPDGSYYVGLDIASALHPQTLLCYEMNGAPLSEDHGAPLRLVIPVKYGIKHLKRIGLIRFTNKRPADYWAEQGYDWYAGH